MKTHIKRRHGSIGLPFRRTLHAMQSEASMNYTKNITHQQSKDYSQWLYGINPSTGQRKIPDNIDPFVELDKAQEAADKLAEIKNVVPRFQARI